MKHDEGFTPENVEEQIDLFTFSQHEGSSPSAQVVQQLHEHYEEDKRSAERIWKCVAQYAVEHDIELQQDAGQPEPSHEVFEEKPPLVKSGSLPNKRKSRSWLALIAATLCVVVLVGSLSLVLQTVRSNHIGHQGSTQLSPGETSHGLYFFGKGVAEKLDFQTHKPVWQTPISSKSPANFSVWFSAGGMAYLSLGTGQLYALDANNGHIRWIKQGLNVGQLYMDDGLLYIRNGSLSPSETLYALDPANGQTKASYKAPAAGWNAPIVVNGILYYASASTSTGELFAIRLSDQTQLWHQQLAPHQIVMNGFQVKNGIVYANVMTLQTAGATGTTGIIIAFDARTGTKKWETIAMPVGVRTSEITNTTIYSASIGDLDAFNALTGQHLWHQKTDTTQLLFDADTLYIAYLTNPPAGGVAALKPEDGSHLWEKSLYGQEVGSPLGVQNGVIYTLSNNGQGQNRAIDAFKTDDGSHLWHLPIGTYMEYEVAFL
ncbi:MAG TPA: PQQ-binding-like beta-propeller repeat protein [Ktedonobacteraceae bacterium]|jgi:outer membrane protein assembly factor BamB